MKDHVLGKIPTDNLGKLRKNFVNFKSIIIGPKPKIRHS